jgi:hypothetical protein
MARKRSKARSAVSKAELRKRMARLGKARRVAHGIKQSTATKSVGERIAKLASTSGMVVEWTLRPQDPSDSVAVGCFCGCGCSCIA